MKKGLIIAIILAVVAAAGAVWYYYAHPKTQPVPPIQQNDTLLQPRRHQQTIETNKKVVYEPETVANPMLVGLWVENGTQHYKIYLDDACDEESYFWGKEWDEEQGIYEEDLTYHGNGWFKWSKTHNELTEIYLSEQGNMVIPAQYLISQLNDSVYIYQSFKITESAKRIPFRTFTYQRIKL